jgi:uncharacterized protein YbjQ (UPF0145 family)
MNSQDLETLLMGLLMLFLYAGVPLMFIVGGYFIGSYTEKQHLAKLDREEDDLADIQVVNLKTIPTGFKVKETILVTGESAIANDYFKKWIGALRNIFGGEVRGFSMMMARGRRQAVVRMLQEAKRHGATKVWNVRIETATIIQGQQGRRQKAGGVEVIAYGTALILDS